MCIEGVDSSSGTLHRELGLKKIMQTLYQNEIFIGNRAYLAADFQMLHGHTSGNVSQPALCLLFSIDSIWSVS